MKRLLVIGLALLSLSFASLINTTDQVNNNNYALGGNSAAPALQKVVKAEGGLTLFDLFGQSKSMLDNQGLLAQNNPKSNLITGTTQPANMFTNLFGQYAFALNNDNWVRIGYSNNSNTTSLIKDKIKDTQYNATDLNDKGTAALYADYSYDAAKYIKGLYLGTEIAFNQSFTREVQKASTALKNDGFVAKTSATLITTTAWYTSLAFSGIYDMNKMGIVTIAQKFAGAKNWDLSEQKDIAGNKANDQWNEESQPETSVGYIYQLASDISLGGTVKQVWTTMYTETRSNSGTYSENDITKWGYRVFTLNGEYKLGSIAGMNMVKDVTLQGYYGFGFDVNRQWNDATADNAGTNDTYMGVNASAKLSADMTCLVGAARTISLGAGDSKNLTDETKLYVNGAYLF